MNFGFRRPKYQSDSEGGRPRYLDLRFAIRNSKFLILPLFLALILLFESSALAQCSMCRTALESSAEGQAIAGGFRKGIVVLLAAPYAIFGTISFAVYRAYRKKKQT
jgi:hypothetical protein